jgi:hypothetical protein
MNHHQRKKLDYYRQIYIHSTNHPETIALIPSFKKGITELGELIEKIDELSMHQAKIITGITVDKNELKRKLIQQVMIISGAIGVIASDMKDYNLLAKVDFKSSEIVHFSQVNLIAAAGLTLDEARRIPVEKLADCGISQEHLDEFAQLTDAFNLKYIAPRIAVIDHSAITRQLDEMINRATDIKMNCLDELVHQFKHKDENFYRLYRRL